jgi:hypothetical protein
MIAVSLRVLMVARRPDIGQPARFGGADAGEVFACHGQAQAAIGSTPNLVGVVVVLAVILPEAHTGQISYHPRLSSVR